MTIINLHTHSFTNTSNNLEIVNQYPLEFDATIPFFSIGIHPRKIKENSIENELKIIEQTVQLTHCMAVGECGLDKRIATSIELQIQVFKRQINIAEKFKKPLIIHCVAGFQELIDIKKKYQIKVPMIVHGFSKNELLAKQLVNKGFYLSFGKYLMQNEAVEYAFKAVPLDSFFLETDSSSYDIQTIYARAAQIKGLDLLTLQNQVQYNYKSVFKV